MDDRGVGYNCERGTSKDNLAHFEFNWINDFWVDLNDIFFFTKYA